MPQFTSYKFLYTGNLWFVYPIDCNAKHHISQSINFPYTQTRNVQTQLKSTVVPQAIISFTVTTFLQMHAIRKDTATLLQTVYLAEIGIQSLQDSEKEGVVGSTPFPPFTLDLGSDNSSDEGVREGRGKRGVVSDGVNSGHETPAKRR